MVTRRILITGANGLLGRYLTRAATGCGAEVAAWQGSRDVDLSNLDAVTRGFRVVRPDAVVHAAALARVSECWQDPARAARVNTDATVRLAELAAASKSRLVYVSTDLVFDGERGHYREDDPPSPLSVYGRTKAAAEAAVCAAPRGAVARVSLLYGPALSGRPSFFEEQVAALRASRSVTLFEDEWRTPLDLATAAQALLALADDEYQGILHVGGPERVTRLEMGQRLARYLGSDPSCLRAVQRNSLASPEPRPRDTSLDSSRWRAHFPDLPWPTLEEAFKTKSVP